MTRDEDQIEEILRDFNFEKVEAAMKAVGWSWGPMHRTPTIPEMKAAVRELFESLGPDGIFVSCGGFRATRVNGQLGLQFILAGRFWCAETEATSPLDDRPPRRQEELFG